MDTFMSRMDQDEERGRRRFSGSPSSHLARNNFCMPIREKNRNSPPQGLEEGTGTVEITPDDAMGLMKALSEDE